MYRKDCDKPLERKFERFKAVRIQGSAGVPAAEIMQLVAVQGVMSVGLMFGVRA